MLKTYLAKCWRILNDEFLVENRFFFLPLHLILRKKKIKYPRRYCQILLISGVLFFSSCGSSVDDTKQQEVIGDLKLPSKEQIIDSLGYHPFDGNYNKTFADLHLLHMAEAEKIGFAPMPTRRDTSRMKGKTVYLPPAEYETFIVDTLAHSMPVLVPLAAKLIDDIAANFRDSLFKKDYPNYKLIVTSITRTDEDIKHLRRRNHNAINESAHRFGTTFDISWLRFEKADTIDTRYLYNKVLKRTLGEVLSDLQQQERCYIKYEKRQACFHITVRKK